MPSSDGGLKPLPLPSLLKSKPRASCAAPATPFLYEPMSRRKRARYCAATGFVPAAGAGVVSVAMSVAAGGEVKSLIDEVQSEPPWHVAQPCCSKRRRPAATSAALSPPRSDRRDDGPLGVRTAKRTHWLSASSAGIATPEPGSVIVSCARPAFGLANAFSTHGGLLMSPLSP